MHYSMQSSFSSGLHIYCKIKSKLKPKAKCSNHTVAAEHEHRSLNQGRIGTPSCEAWDFTTLSTHHPHSEHP